MAVCSRVQQIQALLVQVSEEGSGETDLSEHK